MKSVKRALSAGSCVIASVALAGTIAPKQVLDQTAVQLQALLDSRRGG